MMERGNLILNHGPMQSPLVEHVRRLGQEVIGPAAANVDREGRFPHEAIAALREARLLGACVPEEFGGLGCGFGELLSIAQVLGQSCASTAMIWVMHQMQVACIVQHGAVEPFFQSYLRELTANQLLVASVTSEVGVGGDIRTSSCAVHEEHGRYTLEKDAPTISYADYADGFLVTARRSPSAAGNDQLLILLRRDGLEMEQTGSWDTLGMRGTCSPGFRIRAEFGPAQILPVGFGDIAAQTMVPYSHILWSGCWLGIATDAMSRARAFTRARARKQPQTIQTSGTRLAETGGQLQLMRTNLYQVAREYEQMLVDGTLEAAESIAFAIKLNNLKLLSSELVVQIVSQALAITGMAGYKTDSPYSLGRHLRDSYSAGLMVSNDRLVATNASLEIMHKDR